MSPELSTKLRGDIAEYRVIAELLKRGRSVLAPCGDRLPYDVALDCDGALIRIQVKSAWLDTRSQSYIVDVRRSQTNRRVFKKTKYDASQFNLLIAWIPDKDVFYIFPAEVACQYAGNITMVEGGPRQRAPKSAEYRERWDLVPGC